MTTFTPEQQQLRTLTQYAVDCLNSLNERDQKALVTLRAQRSVFETEIAAIDDVMKDLESTIARRQAKARGDVISQLPATPDADAVDARHTREFDAVMSPDMEVDQVHPLNDAGGHS